MKNIFYLLAIIICFALLSWHDAYTDARIAEHDRTVPVVNTKP